MYIDQIFILKKKMVLLLLYMVNLSLPWKKTNRIYRIMFPSHGLCIVEFIDNDISVMPEEKEKKFLFIKKRIELSKFNYIKIYFYPT